MLNFFNKYKLHLNVVFLFFWLYILYEGCTTGNFKFLKIAPAILFIILSILNIYNSIREKKLKSGN